jgi:hypothetical protein
VNPRWGAAKLFIIVYVFYYKIEHIDMRKKNTLQLWQLSSQHLYGIYFMYAGYVVKSKIHDPE